ncbi:NAD(P)/FAD-dependent oxidoreductase [Tautonia plasticadhaerens]|uniref:NAD(P)/FAD-dependent oxidoreductase n=1 Tax=Tautonia plasticadhaerens TaxID=2527974 RepID=UPI0011A639EE|nr:NAD(P)/FAD-dependent oxidoreductase [Tautonia plasticadhaerens]
MQTPSAENAATGARPRVVIIGAGFAGLAAMKVLGRRDADVTVLDRTNHHLFQPLLYQVATAALNPADIASPIRRIVRRSKNIRVLMGEARSIDVGRRVVVLDGGEVPYDFLIVATGAGHSYFGHDEWERYAPGLKSIEDALEIRRRVLSAFEIAEREPDEARRRAFLSFVIVGAGPTGVELAGTLSEVARKTLARDFRRIDPAHARVILLEGGPRVLLSYPDDLSESAKRQLERLGVEVRLNSLATNIDDSGVDVGDDRIEARTVLWAAGVAASPLARTLGAPLDKAGRVEVEPDLTIPGHPEVFVVGDLMAASEGGEPVPGVAPAAMQAGRSAARNILRQIRGKPNEPFHYVNKGLLATIGRASAVADLPGLKFSGLVAWLLWLFVHIFFLVGFRNRLLVMIQWAYSYFTYDRGARLITTTWHGLTRSRAAAAGAIASEPDHSASAPER